jgi:hypothetical protein
MAKYPKTISLSQELITRLEAQKIAYPNFKWSHLVEELLREHFNMTEEDYQAEQDSILSDLEKELKA